MARARRRGQRRGSSTPCGIALREPLADRRDRTVADVVTDDPVVDLREVDQHERIDHFAEIGIDISSHTSKSMNDFLDRDINTVITVCGNADQACPIFPGQIHRHHWPFDDPAHATGTEEDILAEFRRVRDEIQTTFLAYAAEAKKKTSLSPGA